MAIARYREPYWHVSEAPAADVEVHVFPRSSSVHAAIYTDPAGVVPKSNPFTTGPDGMVDFYAENGDYWLHVGGLSFPAILETDGTLDAVWPATYRYDQIAPLLTWSITHGLNSRPSVEVLIGDQLISDPQVDHVDDNSLTITFAVPLAGVAYLRR